MLEVRKVIPRQMNMTLGKNLNDGAFFAASAAKLVFSGSFLFKLVFIGGLSQLLQMI